MNKLIVLMGLNGTGKAQLAHDLAANFQEQGCTTQSFEGTVDRFEAAQLKSDVSSSDDIVIWNTPADTNIERLSAIVLDMESHGIQPLTIALLDTRTCDCFPTLREEMEQTADLTLSLPFDLKEVLWKILMGLTPL